MEIADNLDQQEKLDQRAHLVQSADLVLLDHLVYLDPKALRVLKVCVGYLDQ